MNPTKYALDCAHARRLAASRARNAGFARFGVLCLLAVLCLPAIAAFAIATPAASGVVAAGMFAPFPVLCKESDDDHGGDGPLSEKQFQSKVLERIKAIEARGKELTANYDNLDKETKAEFEALTKLKNEYDGLSSTIEATQRSMAEIERKLAAEKRAAHGDPIARIVSDERKKTFFNAIARYYTEPHTKCRISAEHRKAVEEFEEFSEHVARGKAIGEDSGIGSNWIQDELIPDIYELLAEHGRVWPMLDVVPASTKTTELLVDTADPLCVFVDENSAGSEDSTMAGTTVSQAIKKAMTLLYVSRELMQDSKVDVSARLLRKFRNAANYRADWICTTADGTADATDGGNTGMFYGGTAAVAASGNVSVATLDFEDVLNTTLAASATVLERSAKWFLHPQMLVRLLKIKDSNGRPIFLTATESPSPGAIGSILGYPVVTSQVCPNTDSTSSKIAAFGDPEAQAFLLRQDFSFEVSNDFRFANDQVAFRAVQRMASKTRLATGFAILTTAAS